MNIRAYNYWASLLRGRPFPSVIDLEPGKIREFEAKSLLLDLSDNPDNPRLLYLGAALRDEGNIRLTDLRLQDVPQGTVVSRLTQHYMEIIANRSPIGFEAEFVSPRGVLVLYRGILMPLSSDGDTVDFIYGVVNWKEATGPLLNARSIGRKTRKFDGSGNAEESEETVPAEAVLPDAVDAEVAAEDAVPAEPVPAAADADGALPVAGVDAEVVPEVALDPDGFSEAEAGSEAEPMAESATAPETVSAPAPESVPTLGVEDDLDALGLEAMLNPLPRSRITIELPAGLAEAELEALEGEEGDDDSQPLQRPARKAGKVAPKPAGAAKKTAKTAKTVKSGKSGKIAKPAATDMAADGGKADQPAGDLPRPEKRNALPEPEATLTMPARNPARQEGVEALMPEEAFLGLLLAEAQAAARRLKDSGEQSGPGLLRTLGLAYEFHLACQTRLDAYQVLLAQGGVVQDPDMPMLAVAQLVFEKGFNQERLLQFAEALAEAERQAVPPGGFEAFMADFTDLLAPPAEPAPAEAPVPLPAAVKPKAGARSGNRSASKPTGAKRAKSVLVAVPSDALTTDTVPADTVPADTVPTDTPTDESPAESAVVPVEDRADAIPVDVSAAVPAAAPETALAIVEEERRALRKAARSLEPLASLALDLEAGGEFMLFLGRRSDQDSRVDILAPVSASADEIYEAVRNILDRRARVGGKRLRN